jgi:hypothetical protein
MFLGQLVFELISCSLKGPVANTSQETATSSFKVFFFEILIVMYEIADPGDRAVCGRSLAGMAGSNPAGLMDVFPSVVFCQVEVSAAGSLLVQRVPPSMLCLSMISKPHRGRIRPLGLSIHTRKIFTEIRAVMKQSVNLNWNWQSGGKN